jgi:hypothetical protein
VTRDEVRQIIWQELQRQMSVVLTGFVAGSSGAAGGVCASETVGSLLQGMPKTGPFASARPWGLASAPPDNVSQVIARGGPASTNRLILGHFDENAPPCARGETALYNQFGQLVRLKDGAILLGTDAAANPLVLGDILQACLSVVFAAIASHTHEVTVSVPGVQAGLSTVIGTGTSDPPGNASLFEAQKSSPINDGAILSNVTFTEK